MIGPETVNTTIKSKLDLLFKLPENTDFYFHAGESTWYGTTVDENLIDAVLLHPKRIAGAYSILKHPLVMKLVQDRKISLEMTPIADQAYKRVKDLRNHPLATLLANNYPVVLGSDIPMFIGTSLLSHDFYDTFLGVASLHSDLGLIKKLIRNSFEYSSLLPNERAAAQKLWEQKWNAYLKKFNAEMAAAKRN